MHLYWWALRWASYALASVNKTDNIYYNDFSLWWTDSNSVRLTVERIEWFFDSPDRDYDDYARASIVGWWLIEAIDRKKTIVISWKIRAPTNSLLESKVNEINKAVRENEKDLYIKVDWTYRVAKATCTKSYFPREWGNNTLVSFELTFQVLEPYFGMETRQENIYSVTSSPYTANFDNNGYAPSNPEYVISFKWSSAVTVVAIATNWYTITITKSSGSWAVGDQLRINWSTMVVTENWTEIEYDWLITPIETGNNSAVFTFTGTVDCTINVLFDFNYR